MDSLPLIVLPPTTVSAKAIEEEQGEIHLSTVEVKRYPAPTNDPIRFLKVLPGISSGNDFSSSYNVSGGNYDQNLLYINGIEIESPFHASHGLAQSISMLNPAMIDSMVFRSISIPVMMGDKLSSLVEANYKTGAEKMEVEMDLGLSDQSMVVRRRIGESAGFSTGLRHANLGRYARGLQIKGEYIPSFWDWQTQIKAKSSLLGEISLFTATLNSNFVMRPEKMRLRYNCSVLQHQEVCSEIKGLGSGAENYEFSDKAFGIAIERLSPLGTVQAVGNLTRKREKEDTDVEYALEPGKILSIEKIDSQIRRDKWEIGINLRTSHFLGGAGLKRAKIGGWIDAKENISYRQGTFLNEASHLSVHRKDIDKFVFLQNRWGAGRLDVVGGIRLVSFGATAESIAMPRTSITFTASPRLSLSLAAGRHAQPPIYKEYLGGSKGRKINFKAQRSEQIGAGLEYGIRNSLHWSTDIYYRHQWRMISYQVDDLRISYATSNDARGYVWGINSKIRGKADSLIGIASYGFLVAREDLEGDSRGHIPMPSDQRHTLSLYLEDRMYLGIIERRLLKYSRFHLRILYGTGFPYTPQVVKGNRRLVDGPRNSRRGEPYFRFDVGLTQGIRIAENVFHLRQEIANLFDQYNVVGYSYFPTWRGEPIEVKRSLGRRVYNLGIVWEF